jgi:serine/threonine-protein kinase
MTPLSWRQVEAIAIAAMERPAHERQAFLEGACGADAALRREVESLLGYEQAAESFLQSPALEEAARTSLADASIESADWQISGYQLLDLLGAGGMGDVYRARDLTLERDVAIKVVRAVGGDRAFMSRFEQEARLASGLNHPNIVTIYGVGHHEDTAYIAMELVRGRTIRAMLGDGVPSWSETLDIAVQLAEGLAAAHAAAIVHRDLKPENVMVTADGLVKILDFGIAKREHGLSVPAPSSAAEAGPTPRSTTISGTAGYMSPEQAAGRAVDHRSDQFSFGAILYELLAGVRAFERETKAEMIAAIIDVDPVPIPGDGGRVMVDLSQVIGRCLAKNPDARYGNTRDIAVRLREIRAARQRDGDGAFSRRRALWLGAATAVTVVTGLAAWRFWPVGPVRTLAVLPFANPAGDDNAAYLCDGLAGSLIRRLDMVPGLEVKALSAVLHFQGSESDSRAIGERLDADLVLTGSLTRRAGRLIVSAELIDVAHATRLWGDVFDRPHDVLAVHDELAAAILRDAIGITTDGEDARRFTRAWTANPRAYELYLQGVHFLRLQQEADYLRARQLLTAALTHDQRFALAHVTLASTYSVMAIDGYEAPVQAWPRSVESINRALDVDPDLPDAHAESSAAHFYFRWDWPAADREWELALGSRRGEVQPELLTLRALQKWALGRTDEALQFARAARQADPLSALCALREADLLAKSGRLDAAIAAYQSVIRDAPDDPRAYFGLADAQRLQGRFDDAIETRRSAQLLPDESSLEDNRLSGAAGYAQIQEADARFELEALRQRAESGAYVSPLDYARAHARLGDRELAFKALAASFEDRSAGLVFLRVDPAWDRVRNDAQFGEAVKRVGLPTAV